MVWHHTAGSKTEQGSPSGLLPDTASSEAYTVRLVAESISKDMLGRVCRIST